MPLAELAGPADTAKRAERKERDTVLGAMPEFGLTGPETGRELVLHAGQVAVAEHAAGNVDLPALVSPP